MKSAIFISVFGMFTLYMVGFPSTRWLMKKINFVNKTIAEFILSFFVGYSLIAIILSNITHFGITLGQSRKYFWLFFLVLFIIDLFRNGLPKIKDNKIVIIATLFILFSCSISYILIGADKYLNYRWTDVYFYFAQTDFHIHYPINTTFDSIKNTPYMAYPITLNYMRIGRSMLQGLVTMGFGHTSEMGIGFISILSPVMMYMTCRLITEKIRIHHVLQEAIPIFSALIPGYVSLELQCFLGASSSVPFIILCVYLFSEYLENDKQSYYLLGLIIILVSASMLIYAEAVLFILIPMLIIYLYTIIKEQRFRNYKGYSFFYILIGIIIVNINFFQPIFIKETLPSLLGEVYVNTNLTVYTDWLYGQGFIKLFFGEGNNSLFIILGQLFYILNFIGLFYAFIKQKHNFILGFIVLFSLHFVFLGYDTSQAYSYYRTLIMAIPITPIAIYLFIQSIKQEKLFEKSSDFFYKGVIIVITLVFTFTSISGIYKHLIIYINPRYSDIVFQANSAFENQWNLVKNKKQDIYFVGGNNFVNYYTFYFGRKNNIWINHPDVVQPYIDKNKREYSFYQYSLIPEDVFILYDLLAYNPVKNGLSRFYGVSIENNETKELISLKSNNKDVNIAKKYKIQIYSKKDSTAIIKLKFKNTIGQINTNFETQLNNQELLLKAVINKGINYVEFELKENNILINYTFEEE